MKCEFCDATNGLEMCCWPVLRFKVVRYQDLKIGDRVRRASDRDKSIRPDKEKFVVLRPNCRLSPATVTGIEGWRETDTGQRYCWWLKVYLSMKTAAGKPRHKVASVLPHSHVLLECKTVCRALVCENHRCERGPKAVYCAWHWRAWEAA